MGEQHSETTNDYTMLYVCNLQMSKSILALLVQLKKITRFRLPSTKKKKKLKRL